MDEISVNSPKEVLSQCTDAPQGKIPTMKYDNRIEVLKKRIKIPYFRAGSISISDKNIAGLSRPGSIVNRNPRDQRDVKEFERVEQEWLDGESKISVKSLSQRIMSITPDNKSSRMKNEQSQPAVVDCSEAEDDIDLEIGNSIRKSAKNEVRRMSHKICNSFLDTMKQQEELELKIVRSAKNEVRRMSQKICQEFVQQLESQDLLEHEIEKSAKAEVRRLSQRLTRNFCADLKVEEQEDMATLKSAQDEIKSLCSRVFQQLDSDSQDQFDAKKEEESIEKSAKKEIKNLGKRISIHYQNFLKEEDELQAQIKRSAKTEIKNLSRRMSARCDRESEDEKLIITSAIHEVKRLSERLIKSAAMGELPRSSKIVKVSRFGGAHGVEDLEIERSAKAEVRRISQRVVEVEVKTIERKEREDGVKRCIDQVAKREVRRMSARLCIDFLHGR